jgi:hypothetical protein
MTSEQVCDKITTVILFVKNKSIGAEEVKMDLVEHDGL